MGVWSTDGVGSPRVSPLRKIPGNFLITSSLDVNHFLYSCTNTENMSLAAYLHVNMHLRKKGEKVSSAAKMLLDLLKQYIRNKMCGIVCLTILMSQD